MSDTNDMASEEGKDFSPAQPLEISSAVAAKADDLLRNFAEEAGLETALVVDRSGALVAGISSEAEVTIDVISALVAGASGAMRALVKELGETGNIESLHQGGDRLLYLREMINRFILVGVSDCTTPAGIVREEASKVSDALQELLAGIRQSEPLVEPKNLAPMKSLRSMSLQRTANRLLAPAIFLEEEEIPETPVEVVGVVEQRPVPPEIVSEPEPVSETEPEAVEEPESELPPVEEPVPEAEKEIFIEELVEDEDLPVEIDEPELSLIEGLDTEPVFEEDDDGDDDDEEALEEKPPVLEFDPEPVEEVIVNEPKEILEPLDFGEPEIVIEQPSLIKSPFEAADEPEVEFETEPVKPRVSEKVRVAAKPTESIFEMALEEDEDDEPVFEIDSEGPETVAIESGHEDLPEERTVFEFDALENSEDEESEPQESPINSFEFDEDEIEETEIVKDEEEDDFDEDEEAEDDSAGRTAGPFYF